jgi:ubiquinone/menaquinone biosynthesis C-methylase UbiE
VIDYDAELQLHNQRLRRAYEFGAIDHVLDIGCGTGQTTREAARLASDGTAIGIDVDEVMIARARERAVSEGIPNVRFEVGDVESYSFLAGEFDVAISRFGTMFFANQQRAFRNIARAIRPRGNLVMMVWQAHDHNEWAVAIDLAVTGETCAPPLAGPRDPFSLADPETVRSLLTRTGFTDVRFTEVASPVYYGQDVTAALAFVSRFAAVSEVLRRGDAPSVNSARARLSETLAAHDSEHGVWFDSRAWIVKATRQ